MVELDRAEAPGLCETLAVASHELRGPLQAIVAAAALLDAADPTQQRQIEVVRRSSERALRLVRELLDGALIGSRRLTLRCAATDLRHVIEEAWAAVAPAARVRNVQLVINMPEGISEAYADADRLVQVLTNLLDNAVRFTPASGHIAVLVEPADEGVQLSVVDEGCGLEAEDLENVFERYWQAPHALRGTAGLGLAITKGIISAHGGRIWAHSVPGAGTAICFTLPAESK